MFAADSDQAGSLVGTLPLSQGRRRQPCFLPCGRRRFGRQCKFYHPRRFRFFLPRRRCLRQETPAGICVQVKDDSSATCQGNFTVTLAHFKSPPTAVLLESGHTVATHARSVPVVEGFPASDRDSSTPTRFRLVDRNRLPATTGVSWCATDSLLQMRPQRQEDLCNLVQAQDDSGATVDSAFTITQAHRHPLPTSSHESNDETERWAPRWASCTQLQGFHSAKHTSTPLSAGIPAR